MANNISIDNYTMKASWGTQFSPDAKFPVIDKRLFETLAAANAYLAYSAADASAIPGLILTVYDDGTNNGAYYVAYDAAATETNSMRLIKLASGGDMPANILTGTQYVPAAGETPASAATGAYANIQGDTLTTIAALETAVKLRSVAENDKILSESNGVLSSTLSIAIENQTEGEGESAVSHEYIVLKGVDNKEVAKVNADAFIKDGMVESVAWKQVEGAETNILVITWNTAAGKKQTELDMSKFVDAYSGSGAVKVNDHTISLALDNADSDITLSQSDAGLNASAGQKYATTKDIIYKDTEGNTKTLSGLTPVEGQANTYTDGESVYTIINNNILQKDGENFGLNAVVSDHAATGLYESIQGNTTSTVKDIEDQLAQAGKVDDVQVKAKGASAFASVVEDKVAKIDLHDMMSGTAAVMANTYTLSFTAVQGGTSETLTNLAKTGTNTYEDDAYTYELDQEGKVYATSKAAGEQTKEQIGTDGSAKQDVTTQATGDFAAIQGNTDVTIEQLNDRINNLTAKGGEPNRINEVKGDLNDASAKTLDKYSDNYVGAKTTLVGTTANVDIKAQYAAFDAAATDPALTAGIIDNGVLKAYVDYRHSWEHLN